MSYRLFAYLLTAPALFAASATSLLLHNPALNRTEIVFSYAGDLWSVNRQGGMAARLTSGMGIETLPFFSPDGNTIAFTGEYDGNIDVFTVPATGGVPKRITYHPDADYAAGWTPDGQRILLRSNRISFSRFTRLFRVSKDGGLPEVLPLPMAFSGSYSPDGRRVAYAPLDGGQFGRTPERWVAWRRYRGGEASYLWIANLADLSTEKIPRTDSNDINPMWIGDKIYFLSDRNGPMTLFRYDPANKTVTEVIKNPGPDIRSASAGPGAIVYEQFGRIGIYDLSNGKTHDVPIEIDADVSEVRPRVQNVEKEIREGRISPTGVRAVFEAHGEILTAPAEQGDIRNLTRSPGVMDRTPSWSPDGQSIAYFSDESGEYALHVKPQSGEGEGKKIPLAGHSAFYFGPRWSPDSKQIAFSDNQLNLWRVDVGSGQVTKIDTDYFYPYEEPGRDIAWSPDSKWIGYSKLLPSRLHVIELYSTDSGQSTQVTDGLSDARYPAFDRDGQYLYFTASTNYGPGSHPLDMTSDEHQVTRNIYALVLPADAASPVAPQSDEEKPAPKPESKNAETAPKPVRVDLADMAHRIVALPIVARDYVGLEAGRPGVLFLVEDTSDALRSGAEGAKTVSKFELKTRKVEKLAEHVGSFDLSFNGEKMLLQLRPVRDEFATVTEPEEPKWVIAPAGAPLKATEGALKLAGLEVRVDPLAEWKQMYHEVWRIERSYFYDPNLHGLDAAAAEKKYETYLATLTSRDDLNYVFQEMLGDITSSHLRGGGGSVPRGKRLPGGLLGADYEIANGHYRFKRIYTGESWNPKLRAPLSGPGINVRDGEYLLEVNGHAIFAADDVSAQLEGTAGKRVVLRVGPDPSGANSREIAIEPVASEQPLRNLAWIEDNRRKVETLSGGKLAYVYMPDTGEAGLTSFNRYFFAQVDKQGLILDERFNGGGQVADYVIDVLNRPLLSYNSFRYGGIQKSPAGSIQGPKVMIINEPAGSGGDMMPWMFRYTRTGTLVGKRTWGGLIGVLGFPVLMDGGTVTAPNVRIFSPTGEWIAENTGVPPDVEVDLDPKSVAASHDPQLERAVSIAMEQIQKNPPPEPHRPPYPDYQHPTGTGGPGTKSTVH